MNWREREKGRKNEKETENSRERKKIERNSEGNDQNCLKYPTKIRCLVELAKHTHKNVHRKLIQTCTHINPPTRKHTHTHICTLPHLWGVSLTSNSVDN